MSKVKPITRASENITKLRENYMGSIINRQESGDRVAVESVAREAGIAAQFEIAIQLAKLNENFDRLTVDDRGRLNVFVDGV